MSSEEASSDAGFTLVEVLVSLAILALSLAVLLGLISDGVRQTSRAEGITESRAIAQSLLAQIGTELPLREGETAGKTIGARQWSVQIKPYGNEADRQHWPVNAYRVSVEVSSEHGGQSFGLTTLRLGPKERSR